MAIPTQPTESSIITKGYRLFRNSSPTAAELTTAKDALAMVKSDLMDEGREWSFLRKQSYIATTVGVNHIQAPTDYSKLISAVLLDGTRRDTAQTGTASTITLASTDSGTVADTEAKLIILTGGTGSGQARQIKDFNTTTKIATIDEDWTTTPDSTSTYLIVDEQHDLHLDSIWNYDEIEQIHLSDAPTKIYHQADDAEGDFYFDYTPDKIYPIRLRYYSDIRKMDTDVTINVRYARILRLIEQLFVQGVFVWLLQDDTRYTLELQKYGQLLARASGQFLYPDITRQHAELAEDIY